jgi:hypothetical protein
MINKHDPVAYRNPTVKDLEAIRIILAYPALTAHEYMMKCYEPDVSEYRLPVITFNNAVLYTRAGRAIAEKGGIAVSLAGRKPRWYFQLTYEQQRQIQQRTAEEQVSPLALDPVISEGRVDDARRMQALAHRVAFASGKTKVDHLMVMQDVIAAGALESHHHDKLRIEMEEIKLVVAKMSVENASLPGRLRAMLQDLLGGPSEPQPQIEMQVPPPNTVQ